MKKASVFLIIICALIFSRCGQSSEYELITHFTNAEGLPENAVVRMKGVAVGHVSSIEIDSENKVRVRFSIDKKVNLPMDSRVILVSNLLGNSSLELRSGLLPDLLGDGQEIAGESDRPVSFDADDAMGFLENIIDPKRNAQQDSLLIELRRLNKNLETMIEQQKKSK